MRLTLRQRRRDRSWITISSAEKEEKVDVIDELLKEEEEDESRYGFQTAGCLRYGTR